MHALVQSPDLSTLPAQPIRVMIVDDSAVVRGLVSRWIEEEPGLEVVARHANGRLAVDDVAKSAPDIVLLDIEMPVMNGLEALPLLLKARPDLRVLMVSTLTRRNAEISFKALALGALDYVPKPDTNREIHHLARFPPRGHPQDQVARPGPHAARSIEQRQARHRRSRSGRKKACFQAASLFARAAAHYRHRQLDGGSASAECSTRRGVGVVVPDSRRGGATHAAGLHRHPERLARATGRETKEGTQDETLKPGTIYMALGNHHMTVVRPANPALRIGNEPPVHFCRPAVDPLFATWPRPSGRRRSASCSPAWAMMVRPAPAPSPRTRGAA